MITRPQVGRRKDCSVRGVLMLSLVVLFCLSVVATVSASVEADGQNQRETTDVLRLHFVPHSDHPDDQQLKLQVRDAILSEFASWPTTTTRAQLEFLLLERQEALVDVALQVMNDKGRTYPVHIDVGERYFDERTFGGEIYPAGMYPSILVVIGDGAGSNWWCVLFPPLCFIDHEEDQSDGMDQFELQGIVHEDYSEIEHDPNTIKWRLRLWETIVQGAYSERVREWLRVAWGGAPPNDTP